MNTPLKVWAFFASLLLALPAFAVPRTFVASTGLDTNACSLTAPCRSFGAAVAVTDANGEVLVLDSAGYGAVVITKSVSIISPEGIYAGVSVFTTSPNQTGITVNGAGIKVVLRGLTINGQGGNDGIRIVNAGDVFIEKATIANNGASPADAGIRVTAASARVFVTDTTVRGTAGDGIRIEANATVVIDRTQIERNGQFGVFAENQASVNVVRSVVANNISDGIAGLNTSNAGLTRIAVESTVVRGNGANGIHLANDNLSSSGAVGASVTRSTISNNVQNGIRASGVSGNPISVDVTDNLVTDNGISGLLASGVPAAVLTASRNTVTRNVTGLEQASGAVLRSRGDNTVAENTVNSAGAITSLTGL